MVAQLLAAPQRARTATPLLAFIASGFADVIALVARPARLFSPCRALPPLTAIGLLLALPAASMSPELRRLVEFQRDAVVAEIIARRARPRS